MTYTRVRFNAASKFQMYSDEANDAVAAMVQAIFDKADRTNATRLDVINATIKAVRDMAEVHPEVRDSEPEWAITDAVNDYFDVKGWVHVARMDVC